jgi:hypothetical protein
VGAAEVGYPVMTTDGDNTGPWAVICSKCSKRPTTISGTVTCAWCGAVAQWIGDPASWIVNQDGKIPDLQDEPEAQS